MIDMRQSWLGLMAATSPIAIGAAQMATERLKRHAAVRPFDRLTAHHEDVALGLVADGIAAMKQAEVA